MLRNTLRLRTLVLGIAVLAVGCSSSSSAEDASAQVGEDSSTTGTEELETPLPPPPFDGPSVDGPLVLSFPRFDSEEALIEGIVALEEDDCVTIGGTASAWPPGTTWDAANKSILLNDGTVVELGDSVSGGGGYSSSSGLEFSVAEEGAAQATACAASRPGRIAVFNAEAEITTNE